MANPHEASLTAANLDLLLTGKYSDITIKCGSREWRAHRSIVCQRSTFFGAACDGSFIESISKKIDLRDDDPSILERLLLYLYTLDYDDGTFAETSPPRTSYGYGSVDGVEPKQVSEADVASDSESTRIKTDTVSADRIEELDEPTHKVNSHAESSGLMVNAKVYAMAEKFNIPQLKFLAKEKFAKHACGWPILNFASVAHEVLTSTPPSDRGLRDIVRDIIANHVTEIATDSENDDYRQLLSVLSREGELVVEILLEKAKQTEDFQKKVKESIPVERVGLLITALNEDRKCHGCRHVFEPKLVDVTSLDGWVATGTLRCRWCSIQHSF